MTIRPKSCLSRFVINEVFMFDPTLIARQRYPYPSESIIYFGYFKLLEFLGIRVFIFDTHGKTVIPAFLAFDRFHRRMRVLLFFAFIISVRTAIKHRNDLTAFSAANFYCGHIIFRG